jgi:acyl-CoA hydrolase
MKNHYKTVASSDITISQLMLPSTRTSAEKFMEATSFLLDQIVFACASKSPGNCVTASVDTVDF